jgi:predicted ATPase
VQLEGGGDVGEQLRITLADGPRLLVLDDLEQLPGLTVEVAALLADLPQLRLLATSRGPLRSRLELELPVRPLALEAAVGLLVDRARRGVAAHAVADRARRPARGTALPARGWSEGPTGAPPGAA